MGWIDAHSHVWAPDTERYPHSTPYQGPAGTEHISMEPEDFSPEILLSHAEPSGVDRVVLIQMTAYGADNSYIADCIAARRNSFRGVGYVDPEGEGLADKMETLLGQGITGFRVSATAGAEDRWLQTPGFDTMFEVAAKTGQAICPLLNPDGLAEVGRMSGRHPETKVVIDHMARIGCDGEIRDGDVDALCALAEHPSVGVKVSAFYALGKGEPPHDDLIPMIRRLRDSFGADRLMWASDCPYQVANETYEDSISLVRDRLDFLSDRERDAILEATAERVFFYR